MTPRGATPAGTAAYRDTVGAEIPAAHFRSLDGLVASSIGLGTYLGEEDDDTDARYGAAGLTASAGVAGWIEFALLRRGIGRRIGPCHLAKGLLPRLWIAAVLATAVALGVKLMLPPMHPIWRAALVLGPFGATYVGITLALGVTEASQALARARRLVRL